MFETVFETDKEIEMFVHNWLVGQSISFYINGIFKLLEQWIKCAYVVKRACIVTIIFWIKKFNKGSLVYLYLKRLRTLGFQTVSTRHFRRSSERSWWSKERIDFIYRSLSYTHTHTYARNLITHIWNKWFRKIENIPDSIYFSQIW